MKTIVVIPTYNERDNIVNLINDIFAQSINNLQIIVVDDNSPDKTAELVAEAQKSYPNLYLIKRYNKLGLGSAYIAGFKKALALGAEFILEMDADFSHDPKDIPRLIETCANGFHLAIGSRKINGGKIIGWNFKRKLMSQGAMVVARIILRLKVKDVTAGFRCYRREVLEKINLDNVKSNGYAFQEEMLYRTQKNKFQIKEIPVTFKDRAMGLSKLSNKDIVEFFITIFRLCTTRFDKV
ncbi:MAG: polyprenol monophosphomannose synthase [Candidatus Magasanikbacteria bacterium]|jgi:dolichol-phosphate mannosyltransferase